MNIQKIQIEYAARGDNCSESLEGVCHIKTLDCISIVQSTIGHYEISLAGGKAHNTTEGGFFIAPSCVRQTIIHHADKATNNMAFRWLFLNIKINNLYYFDDIYELPIILPKSAQFKMHQVFDELFSTQNIYRQYSCYYKIAEILSDVSKEKTEPIASNIKQAIHFIKNNYSQKITIKDLAKAVNLSESHFYSIFRKSFGVSPIAYINSYRLSVAANALTQTNNTITEVSYLVGIDDPIYFNKMFKKAYQMSPTQYRNLYKSN